MYRGRRVLAVVPARGGSKGIKLKNLVEVAGRSLIAHVADVVNRVDGIDHTVVSTDHPRIRAEAERFGLDVPFWRPAELAGDRVADLPVLKHATLESERRYGCRFDIIVMLQPTSPLRRPSHVQACIEKLVDDELDSVWTVSRTDSKAHPLKQLVIQGQRLEYYDQRGKEIIARQMLTPVYHRNGLCYAFEREVAVSHDELLPEKNGVVLVHEPCVSIDTEFDLRFTEFLWNSARND